MTDVYWGARVGGGDSELSNELLERYVFRRHNEIYVCTEITQASILRVIRLTYEILDENRPSSMHDVPGWLMTAAAASGVSGGVGDHGESSAAVTMSGAAAVTNAMVDGESGGADRPTTPLRPGAPASDQTTSPRHPYGRATAGGYAAGLAVGGGNGPLALKRRRFAAGLGVEREHVIVYHIDTIGGSLAATLKFVDFVNMLRIQGVRTVSVIDNQAMSGGSIMAMVTDERYAMPHANSMVHELRTGNIAQYSHVHAWMEGYVKNAHKNIVDIYTKHTHLSRAEVEDMLLHETYLNATQLLQHGFVDAILP